jgi:signal transduction histidine kinase
VASLNVCPHVIRHLLPIGFARHKSQLLERIFKLSLSASSRVISGSAAKFFSTITHELRTPLTPMKAQLQMLEQGFFGPLSDKQKESVNILMRNAERLDKIIEDFLEISRIEAL